MKNTETHQNDFWVFAYGSLMWNPGFAYEEVKPGLIEGYSRSLCILSTVYRGTPDTPGLVLGMDRGGQCCGLAFRIAPQNVNATITYLDDREMVTRVYTAHYFDTQLNDGRTVKSYTYVVKRDHDQYAGKLSLQEQARLVAQGVGNAGPAIEYLKNTINHIDELGIHDAELHDVYELAKDLVVEA